LRRFIDAATAAFNSQLIFYTGKLSCFRPGISTVLPRSIASARNARAGHRRHDHVVDSAALGGTPPERLESGILPPAA
jgi:hypothetical protein